MEPIIAPSAHKHGVRVEDILHAYRQPIRVWHDIDDGMDMLIGPTRSGMVLLEIGVVTGGDGTPVIVHAMEARPTYL